MALIICPECKRRISETADSCPNCGYQLTPEKISEIRKNRQKDRLYLIITAFIILVFIMIIGISIVISNTPDAATKKENLLSFRKQLVWTISKDIIKKSLKSPATANFGKEGFYPEQSGTTCVTCVDEDVYSVKGWVDSQNSFGAIIRTHFLLKMKCDGKTWGLLGTPMIE